MRCGATRFAPALRSTAPRLYLPAHYSDFSTPDRATVSDFNRKEFLTDFASLLQQRIQGSGYVSVAEFMKEALQHPEFGYYSTKKNVIGGEAADFITAAEIPFFGDIIMGWVVDLWQKMGTPRKLNLVELGPGRGSLMKMILLQIKHYSPQLLHFLDVHMVEMGAARRTEQQEALKEFQTADGKIKWWMGIDSIPALRDPTILIANEFFDALPIGRYVNTVERGWVETLVDVDEDPTSEAHFKLVHAPGKTWASYMLPDDLKNGKHEDGKTVEVCTHGMAQMEKIAKRLVDAGKGAALIIDYGKDEHMENTLRGIRGHKFINPLLSPGDVDLSAWVAFNQLRWSLERNPLASTHLKWHPIMTQADFLRWNGIDIRLATGIKDLESKLALRVIQAYNRLMDPEEMGTNYKVMAIQTKNIPNVAPW